VAEELTWRTLLAEATDRLRAAAVPSPEVDARRLVERASGHEGAELVLHLDDVPTRRAMGFFDPMLERRAAGEPLQYVLGRWGFRSLDLLVDRRVLIPRPETEVVVDVAIEELRRVGGRTVVDLGTGSGAIALSIAVEVVTSEVWAVDASPGAVEVARANTAGIGRAGARVRVVEGDWYEGLPVELRGEVDVVVANPPYVAEVDDLPPEVRDWEPPGALYAGPDGLAEIRRIVAAAPAWLRRPGSLVVELAPDQAPAAAGLAAAAGFTGVEVRPDLTGRDRVLVARR
jgi:release factor glutamine methyltransferase